MKKKQSRRARREFKPEFKNDIVRLVRTSGQSVTQIARDMDLTPSAVRAWVAADDRQQAGLPDTPESDELRQLRAENKRLRMERDILVKDRLLRQGIDMKARFFDTEKCRYRTL